MSVTALCDQTGLTFIQGWPSFYLIHLDTEGLIQTSPYRLTSTHIYSDKFHSFFELASGHLILPIFQRERVCSPVKGNPVQDGGSNHDY